MELMSSLVVFYHQDIGMLLSDFQPTLLIMAEEINKVEGILSHIYGCMIV